jgi:phospholipid-binding lipoprotein MlaA
MRCVLVCLISLLLCACITSGPNPDDPYEAINRPIDKFNRAFDATMLKPIALAYDAVTPNVVRIGIDNFYRNINLFPSIANDLLQAEWMWALKDTWRLIINSSIGIGGLMDPASTCQLPPHSNDLGLTLAKWGNSDSPYVIIPFLGPSTIRDGMALLFDYSFFTPYPYINEANVIYGLLGLRYVDLRAQLFDAEHLIQQSLDPYAFMRDAYLQNRRYLITGKQAQSPDDLYVEENSGSNTSLNMLSDTPHEQPAKKE